MANEELKKFTTKDLCNANSKIRFEQWEIEQIDKSERQIELGLVISKEDADKKIEEWLKH
jgi:predicted transcriptional regulator